MAFIPQKLDEDREAFTIIAGALCSCRDFTDAAAWCHQTYTENNLVSKSESCLKLIAGASNSSGFFSYALHKKKKHLIDFKKYFFTVH